MDTSVGEEAVEITLISSLLSSCCQMVCNTLLKFSGHLSNYSFYNLLKNGHPVIMTQANIPCL